MDSPVVLSHQCQTERSRIRKIHLKHLTIQLEQLIFLQLVALYYLDNSSLTFVLRVFCQLWMVNGDSPNGIQARPHVMYSCIVFSGIFASLHHIWLPLTALNKSTYQYGNLFLDFIGQRSPKFRLNLVFLDTFTVLLQLLWLSALEKSRDIDIEGRFSNNSVAALRDHSNPQVTNIINHTRGELEGFGAQLSTRPDLSQGMTSSALDIFCSYDFLGTLWIVDVARYYQEYLQLLQVDVKTKILDLEHQGNEIRVR